MRTTVFSLNNIYHIYNRGVEKRDVFMDDNDRWRFLQGLFLFNDVTTSTNLLWELEKFHGGANFKTIKEYFFGAEKKPRQPIVRIMADCLMPNHYHLMLEEIHEGGISKFMHKIGIGYTMYFNKKYGRVGSLFQGPFKAVQVDQESQLDYLLVYINVMNPGQMIEPNLKEEGIKSKENVLDFAKSYLWSTNKEYFGTRDSIIIDKGILGDLFPDGQSYENFIDAVLLDKEKFDSITSLFLE